jgi:hypothetical protein
VKTERDKVRKQEWRCFRNPKRSQLGAYKFNSPNPETAIHCVSCSCDKCTTSKEAIPVTSNRIRRPTALWHHSVIGLCEVQNKFMNVVGTWASSWTSQHICTAKLILFLLFCDNCFM